MGHTLALKTWPFEGLVKTLTEVEGCTLTVAQQLDILQYAATRLEFQMHERDHASTAAHSARGVRLLERMGELASNLRARECEKHPAGGLSDSLSPSELDPLLNFIDSRRVRPKKQLIPLDIQMRSRSDPVAPARKETSVIVSSVESLNRALLLQSSTGPRAVGEDSAQYNAEAESVLSDLESLLGALKAGGQNLHDSLVAGNALLDETRDAAQGNIQSVSKAVKDLEAERRSSFVNLCSICAMLLWVTFAFFGTYSTIKLFGKPSKLATPKPTSSPATAAIPSVTVLPMVPSAAPRVNVYDQVEVTRLGEQTSVQLEMPVEVPFETHVEREHERDQRIEESRQANGKNSVPEPINVYEELMDLPKTQDMQGSGQDSVRLDDSMPTTGSVSVRVPCMRAPSLEAPAMPPPVLVEAESLLLRAKEALAHAKDESDGSPTHAEEGRSANEGQTA